ncbi:MAG: GNAT family N-acetyltransferase [Saprospiraceae bacterium]
MHLSQSTFRGPEIATVFEPLAALRMQVFRAFPYLYAGTFEYEAEYLKTYADAPRALLLAVFDGEKMVGATTCIPLTDETDEVREPFVRAGLDLEKIFYFGESILLPKYRGQGLGHLFFEVREAHARSFGTFEMACFCAVQRPPDHPARPANYQPLDEFWKKRGFAPAPNLQSRFEWTDVGDALPTAKPMQYWTKKL